MTALPDQKKFLKMEKNGILFKTGSYKDLSKKILYYKKMKFKENKIKKAFKALHKYDYDKNLKLYLNEIEKVFKQKNFLGFIFI